MPTAYTAIASITISAVDFNAVSFTSIPQTYTDLLLYISARTNSNTGSYGNQIDINFNDSGANFTSRRMEIYGTTVSQSSEVHGGVAKIPNDNDNGSLFGNTMVYIPNYRSGLNKGFFSDGVFQDNTAASDNFLYANLWGITSAITKITIKCSDPDPVRYRIGSTFTLFGISNA
jgi:hypothetical protein